MTNITATFTGSEHDLKALLACGIKYHGMTKRGKMIMSVTWTLETDNYIEALEDAMDCINIDELMVWDCELKTIG